MIREQFAPILALLVRQDYMSLQQRLTPSVDYQKQFYRRVDNPHLLHQKNRDHESLLDGVNTQIDSVEFARNQF